MHIWTQVVSIWNHNPDVLNTEASFTWQGILRTGPLPVWHPQECYPPPFLG